MNSVAACSAAVVYVGNDASEAEVARKGATNRTAPIEASGTNHAERTIAVEAVGSPPLAI